MSAPQLKSKSSLIVLSVKSDTVTRRSKPTSLLMSVLRLIKSKRGDITGQTVTIIRIANSAYATVLLTTHLPQFVRKP